MERIADMALHIVFGDRRIAIGVASLLAVLAVRLTA